MAYQDLVETIKALPVDQRLSLLEVLTHSLQADLPASVRRTSTLARARGLLKTDQEALTDQGREKACTDDRFDKYV